MAKKKNKTTVKVPVAPQAPRKKKYTKKPKKPKKFQVDASDVRESDRLFKVVVWGLPIAWKRPAQGWNGNTYNPSKADQNDFVQAIISAIGSVDEPRFGASGAQAEIKFCFPKKASKRKIISPLTSTTWRNSYSTQSANSCTRTTPRYP
jgi:hypothetical protein